MKSLKIEIPKGYEVDAFDEKTGEIRFKEKPKDIRERIKTFDDVLEHLGSYDPEVISYHMLRRVFPGKHHILGYQKVVLIAKSLNEGWVPDWDDDDQYKYNPWFFMGSPSGSGFAFHDVYDIWNSLSFCGSRLCFKSRELALYAGKQFEDIYKDFLTLNDKKNEAFKFD